MKTTKPAHNLKFRPSRRSFLKGSLGTLAACSGLGAEQLLNADAALDDRYLFIIAAPGGANMTDCFLASDRGPGAYDMDLLLKPDFTPFRCVIPRYNSVGWSLPIGNGYSQLDFLKAHHKDMAVMAVEGATTDRTYAPRLAMTGNEINRGRTLAEHIAATYRGRFAFPNISMATGEFAVPGRDRYLSDSARAELISDPLLFAFATHGYAGINGHTGTSRTGSSKVAQQRQFRLELDRASEFYKQNKDHPTVQQYLYNRDQIMPTLEKNQLMLSLLIDGKHSQRYNQYGLKPAEQLPELSRHFPQLGSDPFEAQVALAFLLSQKGLTNVCTLAPTTDLVLSSDRNRANTAPMGFNWSHTDHRGAQNTMWSYLLQNIDKLIQLLKSAPIGGDPAKGSMWSKSVIYVVSDFGRDRVQEGGSGLSTNNAHLVVSPLIKGNRIYGGLDERTGRVTGFNPYTGMVEPGRKITTGDHYSIISELMGAPFRGLVKFPALMKS